MNFLFKVFKNIFNKQKEKNNFLFYNNVIYYYTNKSIMDFYIDYLYGFILELDIPLDNVFVHNKNSNGEIVKVKIPHFIKNYNINRMLNCGIYLVLPELNNQLDNITFYKRIDTWLHEIGHYIHNHFDSDKPLYIQEYEACNYAYNQLKRLPIPVKTFHKDISIYDKRILDIHIEFILDSAQNYVKSFINKHKPYKMDELVESFLNIKTEM